MSLIQDIEVYDRFEKVVLIHGVRHVSELAYADFIEKELPNNEFFGEEVQNKLIYYPTVTREPFRNQGRLTDLIIRQFFFNEVCISKLAEVAYPMHQDYFLKAIVYFNVLN